MLKFILIIVLSFLPTVAAAQQVGLIEHTRVREPDLSAFYSYSRADFDPKDNGGEVEELINQQLGARISYRFDERFGIYGMFGSTDTEFGDTDVEDGNVYGGGFQYVLEPNPDLYLKLTAAYFEHDKQDYRNANGSLEIKNDWQTGVILGRITERARGFETVDSYHSYLGIIYSGREVRLQNSDQVTYELDEYAGLSLTAGFSFTVADYLDLEVEGQGGAIEALSGRLIYYFGS